MHLHRLLGVIVLGLAIPVAQASQPRLSRVWPSSDDVPANLLRLSIEFDAPVEGPVLPRMGLALADGTVVHEPFLQQELWSPDGRTLTVLLHPGRVKTGLVARERWGPILRPGDDVALTLDAHPVKRWSVRAADTEGPVVAQWRLSPVRAATRQPLVVTLDAPIDGRDTDYIVVVDAHDDPVAGHATLRLGDATWVFAPDALWQAGDYRLAVRATLEDPAGNRPGRRFETPAAQARTPVDDPIVGFRVDPSTP